MGSASRGPRFGRNKGGPETNGDDASDLDDEAELSAEQEKQAQENDLPLRPSFDDAAGYDAEPKIREIDEYDAELEAKELRMHAFLNDPEGSMKVFFSSFYKDKGLFWCESLNYVCSAVYIMF